MNVGQAIADHPGPREAEIVLGRRDEEAVRTRLAIEGATCEVGNDAVRMTEGVVDRVEQDAFIAKQADESLVSKP